MSSLVDLFPPFGLRVVAGPLELRGLTDELLRQVCDLAERGIHAPDVMPFYVPWSTAPVGELGRNTAAYHWGKRATFSPDDFSLTGRPRSSGSSGRGSSRSTRGSS